MADIKRKNRMKGKRFKIKSPEALELSPEVIWEAIINRQMFIKKGMSMMYVAIRGETFKTRGEHSWEVALIGANLARRLGGDYKKALRIGKAHDFGHSVLAHTGETALGKFLLSPNRVSERDDIDARSAFDHSKDGDWGSTIYN